MLVVFVTIGMLNVCLGFALAMYYGFGPPGWDGICKALGPLPPVTSDAALPLAGEDPTPSVTAAGDAVPLSAASIVAETAGAPPAGALPEEGVLCEVQELAATAQAAVASAESQAR